MMTLSKKHVQVIDAAMGSFKTSYMIDKFNADRYNSDRRYLYICPYLDEVKRVSNACEGFVEPDDEGEYRTKSAALKALIERGCNIASTHSLLKIVDTDALELLQMNNYTLVIDEMIEVVEAQKVKKCEVKGMIETGIIKLTEPVVKGVNTIMRAEAGPRANLCDYNKYREMAKAGRLSVIDDTALLWLLPQNILEVFDQVYVLTYRFYGQPLHAYFEIFDIEYALYTLDKNRNMTFFNERDANQSIVEHIDKIQVVQRGRINDIGNTKSALSKSWYTNNKAKRETVKRGLLNFFKNTCQGDDSELNMWTTFVTHQDELKGNGYTKGFLPLNLKATNEYRHKKNIAYTVNMFMNPYEVRFFEYTGIEIDESEFALSEMLQFIWRSRIREGKSIRVYVPSKRMRSMLLSWMKDVKSSELVTTSILQRNNELQFAA